MNVKPAPWLRVACFVALGFALVACGAVAGMGQDAPRPPSPPASVTAEPADRSDDKSSVPDAADARDAEQGAQAFSQPIGFLPSCSTCHAPDESRIVGPGLGNVAQRAGQRVEGQSAEDYLRESIVDPSAYVVEGYMDIMPHGYGDHLDDAQVHELVAYLLTLGE